MALTIFHEHTRRVFRGERATSSSLGHSFGGTCEYAGTLLNKGEPPVHLLFRLSLTDASVGITIPGVQWLPFLCAIRYGACELGYRVVSDGEVKICRCKENKAWEGFPYEGYPDVLPGSPFEFRETPYDPGNPEDVLFYAGVFGYDGLTKEQYEELVRHVEKQKLAKLHGWKTTDAFLQEGNSWPFLQGRPNQDCPDPACRNHGQRSALRTLAVFMEERKYKDNLWGPSCDNLEIIYQICPVCAAISTTNQST